MERLQYLCLRVGKPVRSESRGLITGPLTQKDKREYKVQPITDTGNFRTYIPGIYYILQNGRSKLWLKKKKKMLSKQQ